MNIMSPEQLRIKLGQNNGKVDSNWYCTDHFAWIEFFTDCGKEIPDLEDLKYIHSLAVTFEVYKVKLFNNARIFITCGMRSLAEHIKIYSVINSRRAKSGLSALKIPLMSFHLIIKAIKGKAIDFTVEGYTYKQVYDKLDKVHFGGLEIRADGLHADNRPQIWRGNDSGITLQPHYSVIEHDKLFHPTKK